MPGGIEPCSAFSLKVCLTVCSHVEPCFEKVMFSLAK